MHGASDAPPAPVRRLPFARACASVHAKASFACLGISLAFRPTQQIGKGARNQRYCADWMLFISAISAQDSAWHISPKSLVLACSLSTAFIAHYNAPRFYEQVRARMCMRASCEARMLLLCYGEFGCSCTPRRRLASTVRVTVRFCSVPSAPRGIDAARVCLAHAGMVCTAYAVATLFFITVMCAGFFTFGAQSDGFDPRQRIEPCRTVASAARASRNKAIVNR